MWSQTRFTENNTEDCDAAELSELNRRFKSRVLAEECQLHCSLNPADFNDATVLDRLARQVLARFAAEQGA